MGWRSLLAHLRGAEETPRLEAIYVCARAGEPMQSRPFAEVLAGQGLAGDRYCLGTGHWHPVESCEVTLISADDLRRAGRRLDVPLDHGRHRRNLVVAGLRTRDLEGRRFRIGAALFAWQRPRPPCGYLNQVTGENLARALRNDSGVCLSVLEGGVIRVGDALVLELLRHG
jgi:MOSC domain-containing protein YiiM